MSYINTHYTGETSPSPGPQRDASTPFGASQEGPTEPLYASPFLAPPPPPPPPVSRNVIHFQRLLWASFALSFVAVGCSLIYLGTLSIWITPGTYFFTSIFNIVLTVLVWRERRKAAGVGRSVVGALGTQLCAWVLALAWLGCAGVVVPFALTGDPVVAVIDISTVGGFVEVGFDAVMAGLMVATAVMSVVERKVSAALTDRSGGVQAEALPQQPQYTGQSQQQMVQQQYTPNMQLHYLPQIQEQYAMQQQQYPDQVGMNEVPMPQTPPDAMQVHSVYPWGRAMV